MNKAEELPTILKVKKKKYPDLVIQQIASAVGLRHQPSRTTQTQLKQTTPASWIEISTRATPHITKTKEAHHKSMFLRFIAK